MQINVSFENLTEMREFAAMIMGASGSQKKTAVADKPAPQPVSVATGASTPVQAVPVTSVPTAAPAQQPPASVPVAQTAVSVQSAVPTSAVSYTLDDLARAGMTLMDSGRQADLQGLLKTFGVEALPALPKEQYGAFATALRGMGAQI